MDTVVEVVTNRVADQGPVVRVAEEDAVVGVPRGDVVPNEGTGRVLNVEPVVAVEQSRVVGDHVAVADDVDPVVAVPSGVVRADVAVGHPTERHAVVEVPVELVPPDGHVRTVAGVDAVVAPRDAVVGHDDPRRRLHEHPVVVPALDGVVRHERVAGGRFARRRLDGERPAGVRRLAPRTGGEPGQLGPVEKDVRYGPDLVAAVEVLNTARQRLGHDVVSRLCPGRLSDSDSRAGDAGHPVALDRHGRRAADGDPV